MFVAHYQYLAHKQYLFSANLLGEIYARNTMLEYLNLHAFKEYVVLATILK
jgi:hypothetical protein